MTLSIQPVGRGTSSTSATLKREIRKVDRSQNFIVLNGTLKSNEDYKYIYPIIGGVLSAMRRLDEINQYLVFDLPSHQPILRLNGVLADSLFCAGCTGVIAGILGAIVQDQFTSLADRFFTNETSQAAYDEMKAVAGKATDHLEAAEEKLRLIKKESTLF